MKKILFIGLMTCSSLFGEIVLNQNLEPFELPDQFEKTHQISKDTKKLIFAYKKASGHLVKDYLVTKKADYLSQKNAYYIADVSAMPSIIRWFALPALKEYAYPILLIEDETLAAKYKDKKNIEKIAVVTLDNLKVKNIQYATTEQEFKEIIEK